MKSLLLFQTHDFDLDQKPLAFAGDLHDDLGLEGIFQAMAAGDDFFDDVIRKILLSATKSDVETILYRQEILKDCLKNHATVKAIYQLCVEAIERERKSYFGIFARSPGSMLHRSLEVLEMFAQKLKSLRALSGVNANKFAAPGFIRLFSQLQSELDQDYFAEINSHLKTLQFRNGTLVSAELGVAGKGKNYKLRIPGKHKQNWLHSIFSPRSPHFTLTLNPRDEAGARALGELRDRGLNSSANALAQSNDHILGFFKMLRAELAFYLGCVNLYQALGEFEVACSFPSPHPAKEPLWRCQGLCDPSLALSLKKPVVGNNVDANGQMLVLITGANRGGKSTFLRSAGLAQLMMQAGMFVAANEFSASLCDGIFTHFKREEDREMVSGKFDEELARMDRLADNIGPSAMVLFNESFAATNEREGAEIARQIVQALMENHARVFFVTHMFTLANAFYEAGERQTLSLRAERADDGSRSFSLRVAKPLATSFGADLYQQIWQDK
ncbi:MutS domain protein, family 4 [hydrothermal vent metagenome]|uniref:MutS domain protein, family 4 n=1 Tax=hydrothermal vent metagenome TaxID=652676 RepID=A0A3B0TVT0_9ZZZZ